MPTERVAFVTTWFDEVWKEGHSRRSSSGKMVEGWNNWDMLSLMQQVDAFQSAAR